MRSRRLVRARLTLAGPLVTLALAAALSALETGNVGPRQEPPAPPPGGSTSAWFEDATAAAGIDFEHIRAYEIRHWFPEIMSGGAAWCDFDGDGDLDLYAVQGGELDASAPERQAAGNRLYRNLGDGRFIDVTGQAGVGDTGYGMGATCADYDGDGDIDLYVTNVGANVLFRNDGGGTFTDVTAQSGTGDRRWSAGAAFLDHDGMSSA